MAGNAAEDEIQLFEEIKFEPIVMCEQIDRNRTFRGNRLKDGDILCIQKAVSAEIAKTYRYANVTMFLEHMHNRPVTRRMSRLRKNSVAGDALKDLKTKGHSSKDAVQKAMNEPRGVHAIIADGDAILKKLNSVNNNQVVHFRRLEKPKEDDFSLELSRLDSYDDVVATVSIHIGLPDPSKIRLTPHNCFFNQPQIEPIKYRGVKNLAEMLVHCDKRSDILYYEVLDTPLPELATFAVDFVPARNDRVTRHTITLPENRDPEEAINDLKTEVELSHPDSGLSLYAVFHPNMDKIYPPYESVTLEAEEDPKEIQKEPRKSKKGA